MISNFLNPKYLVAPMLDKRNLVAILLVAVFLGVLRASGGTSSLVKPGNSAKQRTEQSKRAVPVQLPSFDPNSVSPQNDLKKLLAQPVNKADDHAELIDQIFTNDQPSGREETRRPSETKRSRSADNLADIEKSLGLQ